jgi:rod shape determining protein RodA
MADYVYTPSRVRARQRRREAVAAAPLVMRLDWLMLAAVGLIVAYGLWVVSSITRDDVPGSPSYYLVRQIVAAVAGLVGLAVLVLIDPAVYRRLGKPIYIGILGMMTLVFLAGTVARGSRRWIDLGFFRFQPSEFGKLLVVLCLAAFLADRFKRAHELRTVAATVALALPPTLLVFIQPDIGSALVYLAALGAVLFVAGTRWIHVAALAVLGILLVLAVLWWLPAAGMPVLKSYQQHRLTGFLNPDKDPQGTTYNITQSITAVGSGGFGGRGVSGASQTNYSFLPEHATDFVFASVAEQRGFLGVAFLLGLYLLVVWRGLKVVAGARDAFSAIAAGGIVFALLFQIFVNVGMTIGVAPVTGVPLPFVSVGGSAMVANLLAIGILQAIHARGRARRIGIARW